MFRTFKICIVVMWQHMLPHDNNADFINILKILRIKQQRLNEEEMRKSLMMILKDRNMSDYL